MIIYVAEKKDANLYISKDLIEINRNTANTEIFENLSSDKIECFNRKQYGYKTFEWSRIFLCCNSLFWDFSIKIAKKYKCNAHIIEESI